MGDLYNFCPVDGTGARQFAHTRTRILSDGPLLMGAGGELPG